MQQYLPLVGPSQVTGSHHIQSNLYMSGDRGVDWVIASRHEALLEFNRRIRAAAGYV